MDFLVFRKQYGFRLLELLALLAFSFLVGMGVAYHEGWADEAQSWLLAKNSGWWQMVLHQVRYEGTPGLWHTILWLVARLHLSYQGMHWLAGGIAVAGVFVFLRWSPFPWFLRLLLPFSFFLAYQYAVVGRSYVLFPLLTFMAVALLSSKRARPVALAIVLGLLANVSLHGFVEAAGLALVAVLSYWPSRRRTEGLAPQASSRAALVIFAVLALFSAYTAFPPKDVSFRPGVRIQKSLHHQKVESGSRSGLPDDLEASSSDQLIAAPLPQYQRTKSEARQALLFKQASVITYPLSESHLLGLALFVLLLARAIFVKQEESEANYRWLGLFPYLLMVVFFSRMYLMPWHAGTLFCSFVASLWLTWPKRTLSTPSSLWCERLLVCALLVMSVEQASWTLHAYRQDVRGPYCGDKAAAAYLAQHATGKKVAGFYFHSVGPVGYLDRPEYFNESSQEYWLWSSTNHTNADAPKAIAAHPDYLVIGGVLDHEEENLWHGWRYLSGKQISEGPMGIFSDDYHIVDYAKAHGYRETHRFCGLAPMRAGSYEELCQIILEPQ